MELISKGCVLENYFDPENKKIYVMPDNITEIKAYAFNNCKNLEEVILPEGLKIIGECAFMNCINLKKINIPDSVRSIKTYAFAGCRQLTQLHIPDGITVIEKNLCEASGVHSIYFPDSVKVIKERAFYRCGSVTEISIPETIQRIEFLGFGWWNDAELIIRRKTKNVRLCLNVPIRGHIMEDHLADFIENPCYEHFILLKPEYKVLLAVGYDDLNDQVNGYFRTYLKRSIRKAVSIAVDRNDVELLTSLLNTGFVTKKNIDFLIQYAINHTQKSCNPECQIMLTEYKNQHFPSSVDDISKRLRL